MSKTPKAQSLPLEKIDIADFNPNKMRAETFEFLRTKLRERGILQPISAAPHPEKEGRYIVIDGAHRLQIYKEAGHKTVQAWVVPLESMDQLREDMYNLKHTHGEWDPKAKALLVREIARSRDNEALKEAINVDKKEHKRLMRLLEKEDKPEKETTEKVSKIYSHTVTCPNCGHKFEKSNGG